jgi:hypothetical protein
MGGENAVAYKQDVLYIDTAVPTNFKVTEGGNEPRYNKKEVNKDRLEELAQKYADLGSKSGQCNQPGPGGRTITQTVQDRNAILTRSNTEGPGEVESKKEVSGAKDLANHSFVITAPKEPVLSVDQLKQVLAGALHRITNVGEVYCSSGGLVNIQKGIQK